MGKTSKGNANKLRTIGNALIGLSMVGVLTIFYPVIKEELLFRTTKVYSERPVSSQFNVRIESIKINAPVEQNVNPWDRNEYRTALQDGVAHAKGSALPTEEGSVYLFAHSSDVPWRMTRYNTAFFRLGRTKTGDKIILTYNGEDFMYRVREKKTVWPNEVEFLTNQNRNQLVLQTCTPIGTSFKRLLVFADPA